MTLLPIARRELRLAARRRRSFWVRLVAALLGIACGGWWLLFAPAWGGLTAQGLGMFQSTVALTFLLCLLAGPLLASDVLSEERREGTLGLLFLTDLRGYDVVLGKLSACALPAGFALLAVAPVVSLAVLIGGVAPMQVLRAGLVLGDALLLSLAAAVFVSSLSHESRTAFAGTVLVLFVLCLVFPWGADQLESRGQDGVAARFLRLSSLPMALTEALEPRAFRSTELFWWSVPWTALMAVAMLTAASLIVPRTWNWQVGSAPGWRWRTGVKGTRLGSAPQVWRQRARWLDRNPYLWLGGRHAYKARLLWALVALAAVGWGAGYGGLGARDWLSGSTAILFLVLVHGAFKLLMASEASQRFAEDRRTGALELVLTTPLRVPAILRGHQAALARLFGPPVAALWLGHAAWLTACGHAGLTERGELLFLVGMLLVLPADLVALAAQGSWLGLVHRRPTRAFVSTLLRVLVWPWIAFLGLGVLLLGLDDTIVFSAGWLGTSLVVDALCWSTARERLRTEFRLVAAGLGRK